MSTRIPHVGEGLFQISPSDGAAILLAARHRDSGRLVFPTPTGPDYDVEALPPQGKLWSYTVQRFRPKSPPYAGPADFHPYAVGYLDFGDLIVEGRLTNVVFEQLHIGMSMRVVALELMLGDPARAAMTYAFAPADGGSAL